MSEAELHILHARMQGGLLNKARRGELAIPLPIGFLYDAASRVILDPDQQVQQSIHWLFDNFRRLGSAVAAIREFRRQGLRFRGAAVAGPRRSYCGATSLTVTRSASCTIRATPAPTCTGDAATDADRTWHSGHPPASRPVADSVA